MAPHHRTSVLRVGASTAIALLALGACSDSPDRPEAARPSGSQTAAGDSPCDLLTSPEVKSLAGRQLDGRSTTINGSTLPVCLYGDLTTVGIQVGLMPADEWAKALPDAVAQLERGGALGSEAIAKQLQNAAKAIEGGRNLPAGQACEFFSTLIELQGKPPQAHSITAYLPTAEQPRAITAQSCHGDTYATLLVGRPDLTQGSALESVVSDTLDRLNPAES